MSRCWIALVPGRPGGAAAAARVAEGGWLGAWLQARKPVREALRADPGIVDPEGAPARVSLTLAARGFSLPVDDLAVQEARRSILAGPPPAAVSLLLADASHLAGSFVAWRPGRPGDDPFARLLPARELSLGPGLVADAMPPAGPVTERYGSANPWPWAAFA